MHKVLLVRMMAPVARVQLSPREHEIVRMVAQGHPNKVSDVLNISSWTVCIRLRRIFAKLGWDRAQPWGRNCWRVARLPKREGSRIGGGGYAE